MATERKHPIYAALETVQYRKDARTLQRYAALPEDLGLVHALDVVGTREGDPWQRLGKSVSGAHHPHFYQGVGPTAACGVRVKVVLPARMDEGAIDPDACPDCAALVESGQASRPRRDTYAESGCTAFLRRETDGGVAMHECRLWRGHDGPHRAPGGAEWVQGWDDFVPGADGYV